MRTELSSPKLMTTRKTADQEVADILARAMEQPGVAEVMAIYGATREASEAAQETMQSLQPHWTYQASNSSS